MAAISHFADNPVFTDDDWSSIGRYFADKKELEHGKMQKLRTFAHNMDFAESTA